MAGQVLRCQMRWSASTLVPVLRGNGSGSPRKRHIQPIRAAAPCRDMFDQTFQRAFKRVVVASA
jgi:hypothetical protein